MTKATKAKLVRANQLLNEVSQLLTEVQSPLTGYGGKDFAGYLLVKQVEETLNKGEVHTKLYAVSCMAAEENSNEATTL
jgi:hypothetical protein